LVAKSLDRRGLTARLGRSGALVPVGDPSRSHRGLGQFGDSRVREVCAVRITGARVDPGSHADAAAAGLGQALDLAAMHPDLTAPWPLAPPLGLARAAGDRSFGRPAGGVLESVLGHTAVPPTVNPRIRTCPWPVPTGAVWPALPQKPVFISKSDPTASIRASA